MLHRGSKYSHACTSTFVLVAVSSGAVRMLRIAARGRCGGRRGRGFRVTGVRWLVVRVRLVVWRMVRVWLVRVVLDGRQQPVQPHRVLLCQVSQLMQLFLDFRQASQGLSQQGRKAGHVHCAVAVRRRCIADAGGTPSLWRAILGYASWCTLHHGALLGSVTIAHLAAVRSQLGAPALGS